MKKILLLTALTIASCSYAATIEWGFSTVSYFGSASIMQGATGYLVYLGENGSWDNVDVLGIINGTAMSSTINTKTSVAGKMSGTGSTDSFTKPVNEGTSAYGFIAIYTGKPSDESTASTWYFLSDVYYIDTSAGNTLYNGTTFTYNWRTGINATSGSNANTAASIAGQGWIKVVPEPATGAMALAGLALLFRRKRK